MPTPTGFIGFYHAGRIWEPAGTRVDRCLSRVNPDVGPLFAGEPYPNAEGPKVRRYTDQLDAALSGQVITSLAARTKVARVYLSDNPGRFAGRRVLSVRSRGKNLVGMVEGRLYIYTHLMMWGRWKMAQNLTEERDRRERGRGTVEKASLPRRAFSNA